MGNEYLSSWSAGNSLEFYKNTRNKRADVYASEDHFLSRVLKPGLSVLDVGCAAGGFCDILRSYEPSIRYAGTDVSAQMVDCARNIHPHERFEVCGEDRLPFEDQSFDLVMCFGTLHMNLKWKMMMAECWRVSKNGFLFDLRIAKDGRGVSDLSKSFMKIAFDEKWDGKSVVPYVIVSADEALEQMHMLKPPVKTVQSFGYMGPVSKMAQTPAKEVIMTSYYLDKKQEG